MTHEMEPEEKYLAMAALVGQENICLRMLAPCEWTVKLDRISVAPQSIGGIMPVGTGPMDAIETAWNLLSAEGVNITVNPQNKKLCRCYRWNGFMWLEVPFPVKRHRGTPAKPSEIKTEQATETPVEPPVVGKKPRVRQKATAAPANEAPQEVPEFCSPCQEKHKGALCRFALEGKCEKWQMEVQARQSFEQAAEAMGERRNRYE